MVRSIFSNPHLIMFSADFNRGRDLKKRKQHVYINMAWPFRIINRPRSFIAGSWLETPYRELF